MNRRAVPFGLLVLSLVALLVSLMPAPSMKNRFDFDAAIIDGKKSAQSPRFIHVQISYPRWIRLNENGWVVVKIGLEDFEGHNLQGWQARLEMNGVVISPQGESRQKAIAGKETVFRWNIRPYKSTAGRGTFWLYQVRENEPNHNPANLVLAHPFEIRIWNGWGEAGWIILRMVSGVGVVASLVWLWGTRIGKSGLGERMR